MSKYNKLINAGIGIVTMVVTNDGNIPFAGETLVDSIIGLVTAWRVYQARNAS